MGVADGWIGVGMGAWAGERTWLQASRKAPKLIAPAPAAAVFRKSRLDSLDIAHLQMT
jgi:hypothetical protein